MYICVKFVFYDLWVNGFFLYFFINLKYIVGFSYGVRMKKKIFVIENCYRYLIYCGYMFFGGNLRLCYKIDFGIRGVAR